jgi:hypothetical protein
MVLGALFYLLLTIWSTSSPPHVVGLIGEMLPFKALYALLLVNTGLCLWRRIPILAAGISPHPQLARGPAQWEVPKVDQDLAQARLLLRRMGCTVREDCGKLWGVRHRWAALGTFLFHGAFFLVALGFFVTAGWRREMTLWVAVGERYEGRPDQILSASVLGEGGVPLALPTFEVREIAPAFWEDLLLFTELRATLDFSEGGRRVTRINRPIWLDWRTFLRLSGFGYALAYDLRGPDGRSLDAAVARMNLFPPGQRDLLLPAGLPHRVYVVVFPDAGWEGDSPVTRSPNLVNPRIGARVYRGRVDLTSALLAPGDDLRFEGFALRFDEIRYWGEFTAVRDPGVLPIFAGFALGLAGLGLKLRGRRGEIAWEPRAEGGGFLRGWGSAEPPEILGGEGP